MKRLAVLLLLVLLLAGCGVGRRSENPYYSPEQAKYFQGKEGVQMRFDQLPPRLYYYGNAPETAANEFPFGVELRNDGASYTRGAVFISGYDPNLVEIREIPVGTSSQGGCHLRFGGFPLNKFGLIAQCGENFLYSGQEGRWFDRITVRGKTWLKSDFLKSITFDLHETELGKRFDIGFDDTVLRWDQRRRGLEMIAVLAGINFVSFLGQEYLLAGDHYDYPGGEIEYVQFNGRLNRWPEGVDEVTQTFLLTNCYLYTTFASPMVCIDPQPYTEHRKVCRPGVTASSSGQGAPVAITRIVQENTPRTAVFHVEVANVGRGTVYDPGAIETCSPYYPGGAKSNNQDVIWIAVARIGEREMECTPSERVVRLRNGRGSFTCIYPIEYAEINSAYETPAVFELWYGYSEVYQQRVPVKRVT